MLWFTLALCHGNEGGKVCVFPAPTSFFCTQTPLITFSSCLNIRKIIYI